MTYFKSAFIAATFICIGAHAQTADSPAAKKSFDELFGGGPSVIDDRSYNYQYKFHNGPSVSFEIQQEGSMSYPGPPVELVELNLNNVTIDLEMIDAINAFFKEKVDNIYPSSAPIACTEYGQAAPGRRIGPCEEIRLQFRADFKDRSTFVHPESGISNFWGFCSIFIRVRERDASAWCHSMVEEPVFSSITYLPGYGPHGWRREYDSWNPKSSLVNDSKATIENPSAE